MESTEWGMRPLFDKFCARQETVVMTTMKTAAAFAALLIFLGLGSIFAQAPAIIDDPKPGFSLSELEANGFPAPAGRPLVQKSDDSPDVWCVVLRQGDTLDGLTAGMYTSDTDSNRYFRILNSWLYEVEPEELPVGRKLCGFAAKADPTAPDPKSAAASAAVDRLVRAFIASELRSLQNEASRDSLVALTILVILVSLVFGYLQRRLYRREWEDAQVQNQLVVAQFHEHYKARLAALENLLALAIAPPTPIPTAASWVDEAGRSVGEPAQLELSVEPPEAPPAAQTE